MIFSDKSFWIDKSIRLLLAVFFPPLAVADKGVGLIGIVWVLSLIPFALTLLVWGLTIVYVVSPLSAFLFGKVIDLLTQLNANALFGISSELWFLICTLPIGVCLIWCLCMVVVAIWAIINTLIFSGLHNFLMALPIIIAVGVNLFSEPEDYLKPQNFFSEIFTNLFSLQALRQLAASAIRVKLCLIHPALAVADMGWKKMLLVFLLDFNRYFSVAGVIFCVIKEHSKNNTNMEVVKNECQL